MGSHDKGKLRLAAFKDAEPMSANLLRFTVGREKGSNEDLSG
jgi:hypothetical protein